MFLHVTSERGKRNTQAHDTGADEQNTDIIVEVVRFSLVIVPESLLRCC